MSIFDWFKTKSTIDTNDITVQSPRRPANRDWTDNETINRELTKGLYHNTYPGMKLAGGLAFTPIAVPVWLMGMPIPKPLDPNDEKTKEDLKYIVERFKTQIKQINLECHRDGTVWVWPKWSKKINNLIWEFIPDDTVSDIIKDVETGEVVEIITDENLMVRVSENITANIRRKRIFSKTKVTITYSQGSNYLPDELKDQSFRNVSGILPIPFSNNVDGDEVRGHTDYERIITDLKDYNDIDLARSTMLAKFNAKMVQEVDDLKIWMKNNGFASFDDIDVATTDLIINRKDKESTTFVYPERAHEAYSQALSQKFKKIVEASGIPEIAWGLKTSGNHASVEESMASLVKYVHDKQEQKTDKYKKLFFASLELYRLATLGGQAVPIGVEWNDLDAVSDATKAKMFFDFANGVAALIGSAGFTKKQLYNFWKSMYPKVTEEEFEDFVKGLSDMGAHKQWTEASYTETLDFQGDDQGEED